MADQDARSEAQCALSALFARLRAQRLERGWSQVEMAARLKVSASAIREWESARECPTIRHLVRWCRELGLRLALVDRGGRERPTADRGAFVSWEAGEIDRLACSLREARLARSATQAFVCDRLGVTPMSLVRWESGRCGVRPVALVRWAAVLGLSLTLAPLSARPGSA